MRDDDRRRTSGFASVERRWAAASSFRLHARLAVDAVDTTYLAWWAEGLVVVKRVHAHLLADEAFTQLLRDRAARAVRLVHPNVVRTLGLVDEPDELAIVTEYVPGASLAEILDALPSGNLPPPIATAVVAAVLRGLAAAHGQPRRDGDDFVHQRLSRQDVLLGEDGIVRIRGFDALPIKLLTEALGLATKLPYISPEELAEGRADARSDTYAAAVLLWEALTGQALFRDTTIEGIVRNVLAAPVPPPSAFAPAVSPALDAIVLRGLRRDSAARFSSAEEMATALERGASVTPASSEELTALLPSLELPGLTDRRATARIVLARERASRSDLSS